MTYYVAGRLKTLISEMDTRVLFLFACSVLVAAASAWSIPYQNAPRPLRVTRYAPPPNYYRIPVRPAPSQSEEPQWERPKRQYDHHDHDDDHRSTSGVTGPVHTFVKTDKNANYKWGVRHHVGNKYAS